MKGPLVSGPFFVYPGQFRYNIHSSAVEPVLGVFCRKIRTRLCCIFLCSYITLIYKHQEGLGGWDISMYKEYFGLKEPPFSIAPDPHYLYMSDNHREALAHLLYGINSDNGFVLLTGDVGTGKTTVCRCLLQQLPVNSNIAFILNPKVTVDDLLATICDELGIGYPAGNTSNKVFIDRINAYLLGAHAQGQRTVIIVEEAQNLSPDALEQIRLLTNLETNERKLLQIIMIGQPELNGLLARSEMGQLRQRITARYHLRRLAKRELGSYVLHRLAVAGVERRLFPASTIDRLYKLSGGIPRMVNLLCDRALLGTYVKGKGMVDVQTLNKAAREVADYTENGGKRKNIWVFASLLLIVCMGVLGVAYYNLRTTTVEALPPVAVQPRLLPPPSSPVTDVFQLSASLPSEKSQAYAFKALFRKWGIDKQQREEVSPCQQALSVGLQCLHKVGSISSLIKLNGPAVLRLHDEKGRDFYIALTAVKGDKAIVETGGDIRTVDLREIENKWADDYTVLWNIPPGYQDNIHPGIKGMVVAWIDLRLAAIQGREAGKQNLPTYEGDLVAQMKKFQNAEGLPSDGIVGPETIIHLNTAAGSNVPKLVQ
jgi:general secretion pathway protein A